MAIDYKERYEGLRGDLVSAVGGVFVGVAAGVSIATAMGICVGINADASQRRYNIGFISGLVTYTALTVFYLFVNYTGRPETVHEGRENNSGLVATCRDETKVMLKTDGKWMRTNEVFKEEKTSEEEKAERLANIKAESE